jgi:hypothetical protein
LQQPAVVARGGDALVSLGAAGPAAAAALLYQQAGVACMCSGQQLHTILLQVLVNVCSARLFFGPHPFVTFVIFVPFLIMLRQVSWAGLASVSVGAKQKLMLAFQACILILQAHCNCSCVSFRDFDRLGWPSSSSLCGHTHLAASFGPHMSLRVAEQQHLAAKNPTDMPCTPGYHLESHPVTFFCFKLLLQVFQPHGMAQQQHPVRAQEAC